MYYTYGCVSMPLCGGGLTYREDSP